ncbi:hypothetical protein AAC03nite_22800 [Alicyclobacillus acidoterrestris]|uniref:class II aldolase/adducin family protein n=1 Tax=Alicyclobacillus suci TaxID=2816080 RepID=UPI00119161F2|nr:class II aldolase/adducin family protein [Alicyclobacillus suci]GEO26495.1 hypothetical protein AAC03nite_22800 [Alicyclobacillus acidoterrestris]
MNLRMKLAETVRLFEAMHLFDMNGHVSVRLKDGFLTHGQQASRAALTVNDVIEVDWDGVLKEGQQEPPNEIYLHSEIYRARKDVQAIAHFHGHWINMLSVAGVKFVPVSSVACGLGKDIPIYSMPDSISTAARGREVAACLGTQKILILRAHGAIVTGSTLEEVLVAAKYLEINAQRQVFAQLLTPGTRLADDEIERIGKSLWTQKNIKKSWTYYYEKAKRDGHFYGVI